MRVRARFSHSSPEAPPVEIRRISNSKRRSPSRYWKGCRPEKSGPRQKTGAISLPPAQESSSDQRPHPYQVTGSDHMNLEVQVEVTQAGRGYDLEPGRGRWLPGKGGVAGSGVRCPGIVWQTSASSSQPVAGCMVKMILAAASFRPRGECCRTETAPGAPPGEHCGLSWKDPDPAGADLFRNADLEGVALIFLDEEAEGRRIRTSNNRTPRPAGRRP